MKRILIVILSFLFISNFIIVNASDVYYNDNKTSSYSPVNVEMEGNFENTKYQKINAITTNNGLESKQMIYTYVQNQTSDSKVVTWAVSKDSGKLENATVAAIASDYEKHHEDWIVVGGINADQYTTGFGTDVASSGKDFYSPQTYYPFICDGEGWFAVTAIPYFGHNIAGFLQDGSNDPIVSGSASLNGGNIKLSGLFLYLLDSDGKRVEKFFVDKFNESPKADETTLWTSFYTSQNDFFDIKVPSGSFVVENAIRAYSSNSIDYANYKDKNAYNAFFGKGNINKIANNETTVGYGDFAIETKNEYVKTALKEGMQILVQYEYEGVLSSVESATGYHSIQRMDGKDVEGVGSYNTLPYPRSVVGRTSDGKIVLLAVDGKAPTQGRAGTTHGETNAILSSLDVVEAYQMDGGGSVTAVVRNEKGTFDTINKPADGSARRVLTALLLVERKKPEVVKKNILTDDNDVIINFEDFNYHGYDVEEIKLNINNQSYEVKENENIVISGLTKDVLYRYTLSVKINGKEYVIDQDDISVSSRTPEIKNILEVNKFAYKIEFDDPDNVFESYYILVEDKQYQVDEGIIKLDHYIPNKTYIVIKYKKGDKLFEEKLEFNPYKSINVLEKMLEKIYNDIDKIYN